MEIPSHVIRLAGPWTLSLSLPSSEVVLVQPAEQLKINLTKPDVESWQIGVREQLSTLAPRVQPSSQIEVRLKRKFNQPTGLTTENRLLIEIEFAEHRYCDQAAIKLNEEFLSGAMQEDSTFQAQVNRLESFNVLEVCLPIQAADAIDGSFPIPPFKSARLVLQG